MREITLFEQAVEALGYTSEQLRSTQGEISYESENLASVSEWVALGKARKLGADYVYFRRFESRPSLPQFYVYLFNDDSPPEDRQLAGIQKDVWSSGEVPCAMVFTRGTIEVLNTNKQTNGESPVHWIKRTAKIDEILKQKFSALQFDTGRFWDNEADNLSYNTSAHKTLLNKLKSVRDKLKGILPEPIVNRFLMQCILIRYLEERKEIDQATDKERGVFPVGFFEQYGGAKDFRGTLENGRFLEVFKYLNAPEPAPGHLNGAVFEWSEDDEKILQGKDSRQIVNLLYDVKTTRTGQISFWDLYSFRYLPVELISSIYEALFTTKESKSKEGMVYTPPHLARFLVDECMPVDKPQADYKVLDPACGSGVFLVLAFRRIVEWWRLQNHGKNPAPADLMQLLKTNIFGVDKEKGAVELSRFSLCLALCDQLSPYEIWHELQFPNLENLADENFFDWQKNEKTDEAFDLVIGNPPFQRGAENLPSWDEVSDYKIPQNQIALYFLCGAMKKVTQGGLLCLLVKSTSILHTTTGNEFRKQFFHQYNIPQIVDFTPLARNKKLWNKADVDACAVFAKNEPPDFKKSILHLVVKRNKVNNLKRYFEIDAYDFHWVSYSAALQHDFVWKCNLLGGARLALLIKYAKTFPTLKAYSNKKGWLSVQGYRLGKEDDKEYDYINDKPYLPTEWLGENGIERDDFQNETSKISEPRSKELFMPPKIMIKTNAGHKHSIPMSFSDTDLTFREGIIGISASENEQDGLYSFFQKIRSYNDFYRAFLFACSPKCLVYMNTVVLAEDIYNLPYPQEKEDINLSPFDKIIIHDVVKYYQDFLRHPEDSLAYHPIESRKLSEWLNAFGGLFCEVLNSVYAKGARRFRQGECMYNQDFILVQYHLDSQPEQAIPPQPVKEEDLSKKIKSLLTNEQGSVRFQRILKIYGQDSITFVKPNQYRYWLDSIALRDADGVLADSLIFSK